MSGRRDRNEPNAQYKKWGREKERYILNGSVQRSKQIKWEKFSAFNIFRTRNHFAEVLENLCQKIKERVTKRTLFKWLPPEELSQSSPWFIRRKCVCVNTIYTYIYTFHWRQTVQCIFSIWILCFIDNETQPTTFEKDLLSVFGHFASSNFDTW